jgi:hypothetical protein
MENIFFFSYKTNFSGKFLNMIGERSGFAKPDRRAGLIYIDVVECDCCDKKKKCAHIHLGITGFVWNICKDCLNEFVFEFYTEKEVRKMKLVDIQNSKPNVAQ